MKFDGLCPLGHGWMRMYYAVDHFPPHFTCEPCQKVYVREYGELVQCLNPGEHLKDPPPWVKKVYTATTPPLRAHDVTKKGAQ